jgi:hypothetical protein
MTKHKIDESEFHARDRYAVAEKIDKEFRERRGGIKPNELVKKQK